MTNWMNVQIDIKMIMQTIENIDCEVAKLENNEDNEDKLDHLFCRLNIGEKALQKDLQKAFGTTLPRGYCLIRKKIKVSVSYDSRTIFIRIPRSRKIEFFSKERKFKRLLVKIPVNMYSNTTKKESHIFITF